jgi:hypothetical protein
MHPHRPRREEYPRRRAVPLHQTVQRLRGEAVVHHRGSRAIDGDAILRRRVVHREHENLL